MARRAVTSEWIDRVKERLHERQMTQRELAEHMGVTEASISLLLKSKVGASPQVEPISDLLGIALPDLGPMRPLVQELADIAKDLDDDDIAALLSTAKRFKR